MLPDPLVWQWISSKMYIKMYTIKSRTLFFTFTSYSGFFAHRKNVPLSLMLFFSSFIPLCIALLQTLARPLPTKLTATFPRLGSSVALAWGLVLISLSLSASCDTDFVLEHHSGQWPPSPNRGHLQRRETLRWLIRFTSVRGMPGRWTVMNTECWSLVIRLPSVKPQNTGSSFPLLTSLTQLPSILGRHSSWPRVRGLADVSRKLGRSKCIFTRTACKSRVCFIKCGFAWWHCLLMIWSQDSLQSSGCQVPHELAVSTGSLFCFFAHGQIPREWGLNKFPSLENFSPSSPLHDLCSFYRKYNLERSITSMWVLRSMPYSGPRTPCLGDWNFSIKNSVIVSQIVFWNKNFSFFFFFFYLQKNVEIKLFHGGGLQREFQEKTSYFYMEYNRLLLMDYWINE